MASAGVTAGKRAWAWRTYLVLGLLAVAGYSLVPSDSIAALNIHILAIGFSAVVAILLGIRLNRPAYSRPWYLILIGELMLLTADAVWGYYEVVLSIESPFPSWADVIYFVAYMLWAAG